MGKETPEWVALALIKLAANDHQLALKQMNTLKLVKSLNGEQLEWV